MNLLLSKNLKQKLNLNITSSLRKSIDLLQLSRFELVKKIENEISDNPFLEKEYKVSENSRNFDDGFNFDFESKISLRDHLLNQLSDLKISKEDYEISKMLIECIDESGKLTADLNEINKISNHSYKTHSILKNIYNVIQKMTPIGIGFRNHKECIKIQIEHKELPQKKKNLILDILFNEDLDDIKKIKEKYLRNNLNEKFFEEAISEIKACDLSPGLNYENTQYIEADLKVSLNKSDLKVDFIDEAFPLIKIDNDLIEEVKKELKNNKNPKILKKINDAKWLLTSVKKRNNTITKVGEYICQKQLSFFYDNPIKINTLNNKDIAEDLGLHPSTISRILRYKYIDTPKGIMPLKALLVPSVSKGRKISEVQLSHLIAEIIKFENRPKSDKKITIELNKRGINLARRTVTKYREKINIPSSRYR